jgi:hypothetical protein
MSDQRGGVSSGDRWQIEEQRRREQTQKKPDIEDIDGDINWAYSQMRIIEQHLEESIERNGNTLSNHDQKRIDKALVVTRTGLKMLKKVVKKRSPMLDTAAWKTETAQQ